MMWPGCVIILILANVALTQKEGESCLARYSGTGICINIKRCITTIEELKHQIQPLVCSFDGVEPIVCCTDKNITLSNTTVATPSRPEPTTTTTTAAPVPLNPFLNEADGTCRISSQFAPSRTGRKAWDKCLEYQEQLVYPCNIRVPSTGQLIRADHCTHNESMIDKFYGRLEEKIQFPYMAVLGYIDPLNGGWGISEEDADIEWWCGGTLISDRFIMTAAGCRQGRDRRKSPVKFAAVGILTREAAMDPYNRYKIKNIIVHPEYSESEKHHNIALLETDRQIALNRYVVPACLDFGDALNDDRAIVTTWNYFHTQWSGGSKLEVEILRKNDSVNCATQPPENADLNEGSSATLRTKSEICYYMKRSLGMCRICDCQMFGGALQVENNNVKCMYTVIGIETNSRCHTTPYRFVRVSYYLSWIEGIVWP